MRSLIATFYDPRTVEGASRTLRQLLGYGSVVNEFDSSWNSAPGVLRSLTTTPTIEY